MRKNTKIKMIISALAVLAVAPVAGIAALNASADETAQRANYEVVGASIKYKASEEDTQNGIRFAIDMEDSLYASTIAQENVEMGTLIIPADILGDNELTVATASVNKTVTYSNVAGAEVASVWGQAEDVAYTRSIVYLWGINDESFNRPLTVVGYYTVGETTTYTAPYTVAVADVALAAINDAETTETQKTELNGYVKEYTVTFYDDNGTDILDQQQVKYGATVSYAGTTPVKADTTQYLYSFKGWDKEVVSVVKGTASYTATYTAVAAVYSGDINGAVSNITVTAQGDGWLLTNANTNNYTYTFSGAHIAKQIAAGKTTMRVFYEYGSLGSVHFYVQALNAAKDAWPNVQAVTWGSSALKAGIGGERYLEVNIANPAYDFATSGVRIITEGTIASVTIKRIEYTTEKAYDATDVSTWIQTPYYMTYTIETTGNVDKIVTTMSQVIGQGKGMQTSITLTAEYIKSRYDLGYRTVVFSATNKPGQFSTRDMVTPDIPATNSAAISSAIEITQAMLTNGFVFTLYQSDQYGTGWNPTAETDGYVLTLTYAQA